MPYALAGAKVWDGASWVAAVGNGGGGGALPWFDGANVPVSSGSATVTADSSAHTKGAWTEIVASTSGDATALRVEVTNVNITNTATATLLDIGFGAASSEVVKISNVAVGAAGPTTNYGAGVAFIVPLQVPSGTRIAARIQSVVTGGKTATVTVQTIAAGDYGQAPTSLTTLNTDTATSGCVNLGPSNAATWAEIVASAPSDFSALIFVPSFDGSSGSGVTWTWTMGLGGAGSEVAFGPNLTTRLDGNEIVSTFDTWPVIGMPVPSGSRIAVQRTGAFLAGRIGFTVIGVP